MGFKNSSLSLSLFGLTMEIQFVPPHIIHSSFTHRPAKKSAHSGPHRTHHLVYCMYLG